jgi:hypothetical protein
MDRKLNSKQASRIATPASAYSMRSGSDRSVAPSWLDPGTEVVVLSMAPESSAGLHKALAMGAIRQCVVDDALLADLGLTAEVLAAAARTGFDLVIGESVDGRFGRCDPA